MNKIAVTGGHGHIGKRLVALGCESLSCDITDAEEVWKELSNSKPDTIIHLASKSSIDFCQSHYEEAVSVNTFGTSVLSQTAEEVIGSGRVVVVSTDQVFDGKGFGNYKETDEPNPINHYGLTKLGAEAVAKLYENKVVRISRCFDSKSDGIKDYLERVSRGEYIQVPYHIERSYTHLDFIAKALLEYAKRFDEMPEILHLGGAYPVTFYDLISEICKSFGCDSEKIQARGELKGFSPRPFRCGLDVSLAKSLGLPIYDIHQSVERMKHERQ